MEIIKAQAEHFEIVKEITHQTISEVYPHFYPKGVVDFFLAHHKNENIMKDIHSGDVYLLMDHDEVAGTVTINENEINRLFVLPSHQRKGYGRFLLDFAEKSIAEKYPAIELSSSLPAREIYLKRGYIAMEPRRIVVENGDVLCFDWMKKNCR
jgi:GNAT superfamily N-acetyltransferase